MEAETIPRAILTDKANKNGNKYRRKGTVLELVEIPRK